MWRGLRVHLNRLECALTVGITSMMVVSYAVTAAMTNMLHFVWEIDDG